MRIFTSSNCLLLHYIHYLCRVSLTSTINTLPDIISLERVKEKNSDSIQLFASFFFQPYFIPPFHPPGSGFTSKCVRIHALYHKHLPRDVAKQPLPFSGPEQMCVFAGSHHLCIKQHTHTCLPNPVYVLVSTDFSRSAQSKLNICISS